jgi:hypothetical protein
MKEDAVENKNTEVKVYIIHFIHPICVKNFKKHYITQ